MNASTTHHTTAHTSTASGTAEATAHTSTETHRGGTATTTRPTTMDAAVQRHYANPDSIHIEAVPVPTPGAGEVLIEVRAAGVDRGVWHLATGRPLVMRVLGFGLRRPKHPVQGSDVAGVVVQVGAGVTRLSVGDHAYGTADGSFARFAVAKESRLATMPATATWTEAAAMPVSGVTALQAVVDTARVTSGQRVLILGASGGVGSFATQLAASAGAHVTGVASAAKASQVRALGAERVIDYRTTDVTALQESFDAIIDAGGLTPVRRLRRILAPAGTLVIVGGEGGGPLAGGAGRSLWAPLLALLSKQRLTGLMSSTTTARLERLSELVDSGQVRATVSATYRLDRAADAVTDLAAGRIVAKAVLIPHA